MSTQLGLTDKQVRTALNKLIEEGNIKHEGPDHGGQWIIL